MTMRKWLLICLSLVSSLWVEAQTTITGRVFDGANPGQTLDGVRVKVPDIHTGTISDLDGNFQLEMPDGKFIIQRRRSATRHKW